MENEAKDSVSLPDSDKPEINLNFTVDDFDSAFAKAAFLTVKAARDSLEAAQKTGVNLESAAANARSAFGNNEVTIGDLGPYILTANSARRSASGENTLENELNGIAGNYEESLSDLVPALDAAVLAGLLVVEDGNIVISDDMVIPVDSLDGIATIEVMNRVAGGENPEAVVSEMQADIAKMLAGEENASRGVYIIPENSLGSGFTVSGARWTNGLIRYHFATGSRALNATAKDLARKSMDKWTAGTNNKVRFEEINANLWNIICRGLGQYQYVTIDKQDLPSGTAGRSTVGSLAVSFMHIDIASTDKERTYLHELGHVIGLKHEHQWSGRDAYIKVSSSDTTNYGIIPEKSVVAGLYPVRIWFITIYLPYIWYVDYSKHYGSGLDFKSIMLYPDKEIKPPYANSANGKKADSGKYLTIKHTVLSEYDKQTVKAMY
ncbi:MAG: hypothetical protein LBK61_08200 [Spirochaetaceae bacterium]|nr:hypothetical protein [Spirochaetaceae bacterium]